MSFRPEPDDLPVPRGEVHLFRLPVPVDDARLDAALARLMPDERARALRYVVDRPRREFAHGRATLRRLLGRYLSCDPAAIELSLGPDGKPELARAPLPLRFNLSHSHGLVLVAVTVGIRLGVDVERRRDDLEHLKVAERFFSAAERDALRAVAPGERAAAFFRCWTRKEALLKARGTGLRTPLRDFDVSLEAGTGPALLATRFEPDEADRWHLASVPAGTDHEAALAVEGKPLPVMPFDAADST